MNHYEILGVTKTASLDEIKQAYKKLAKEHHPDRGGDTNKFAEINAAYDVLKDPAKRQEYDNSFQHRFTTKNNFNSQGFEFNFFNDIFEKTFKNYTVHVNRDITIAATLSLKDTFKEKTIKATYRTSIGTLENVDVNVPAGIKNGDVIRLSGLGDNADSRFPRGNLNIRIHVSEDPLWKRNNNDLWTKKIIDVFDLLLGCVIIITTPEGNNVKLNIPKGSNPTSIFNIPNYGIPDRVSGDRGNIYVQLEVTVPNVDDTSIINKIKDIKDLINNKDKN